MLCVCCSLLHQPHHENPRTEVFQINLSTSTYLDIVYGQIALPILRFYKHSLLLSNKDNYVSLIVFSQNNFFQVTMNRCSYELVGRRLKESKKVANLVFVSFFHYAYFTEAITASPNSTDRGSQSCRTKNEIN